MKNIKEAQRAIDTSGRLQELRDIEAREHGNVYETEYSVSSSKGRVTRISKTSSLELLAEQIHKLESELEELGYDPHA